MLQSARRFVRSGYAPVRPGSGSRGWLRRIQRSHDFVAGVAWATDRVLERAEQTSHPFDEQVASLWGTGLEVPRDVIAESNAPHMEKAGSTVVVHLDGASSASSLQHSSEHESDLDDDASSAASLQPVEIRLIPSSSVSTDAASVEPLGLLGRLAGDPICELHLFQRLSETDAFGHHLYRDEQDRLSTHPHIIDRMDMPVINDM